jgi:3-deoxy-D-manno-octulosonate 8-phosphate phosphatase (KDO 8-P phosphatase)
MSAKNKEYSIETVDAFIFDFDGVLTNNRVYLNQDGKEWVSCSRADGLAFDLLRKLKKPAYILSTEKNPVVSARAKKIQVPVLQGVSNKVTAIKRLAEANGFSLTRICYLGNDLNDYRVMQLSGITACPADSHPTIKQLATITLQKNGGEGVVRELLEEWFNQDFLKILYQK